MRAPLLHGCDIARRRSQWGLCTPGSCRGKQAYARAAAAAASVLLHCLSMSLRGAVQSATSLQGAGSGREADATLVGSGGVVQLTNCMAGRRRARRPRASVVASRGQHAGRLQSLCGWGGGGAGVVGCPVSQGLGLSDATWAPCVQLCVAGSALSLSSRAGRCPPAGGCGGGAAGHQRERQPGVFLRHGLLPTPPTDSAAPLQGSVSALLPTLLLAAGARALRAAASVSCEPHTASLAREGGKQQRSMRID